MEQATVAEITAGMGESGGDATGEEFGKPTPRGGPIPILRAIRAYAPDFSCGAALDCLCRPETADLGEAVQHLRDALDQGWRPAPENPSRGASGDEDVPEFGINEFLDDWELQGDRRAAAMFLMLAGTFFDGEAERMQYLRSALGAAERAHRAAAATVMTVVSVQKPAEDKSAGQQQQRSRSHICERCWTSSWEACVEGHADAMRDPATGGWMYCVHCALIAAFHGMDERREAAERDAGRLAVFLRQLLARNDMHHHPRTEAGQDLLADVGMAILSASSHRETTQHFAPAR